MEKNHSRRLYLLRLLLLAAVLAGMLLGMSTVALADTYVMTAPASVDVSVEASDTPGMYKLKVPSHDDFSITLNDMPLTQSQVDLAFSNDNNRAMSVYYELESGSLTIGGWWYNFNVRNYTAEQIQTLMNSCSCKVVLYEGQDSTLATKLCSTTTSFNVGSTSTFYTLSVPSSITVNIVSAGISSSGAEKFKLATPSHAGIGITADGTAIAQKYVDDVFNGTDPDMYAKVGFNFQGSMVYAKWHELSDEGPFTEAQVNYLKANPTCTLYLYSTTGDILASNTLNLSFSDPTISDTTFAWDDTNKVEYAGKNTETYPGFSLTLGGYTLVPYQDFTWSVISTSGTYCPGSYTLQIEGAGSFSGTGTLKKSFTITKKTVPVTYTAQQREYDGTSYVTVEAVPDATYIAAEDLGKLSAVCDQAQFKTVNDAIETGAQVVEQNATAFVFTSEDDTYKYYQVANPYFEDDMTVLITAKEITAEYTAVDRPYDGTADVKVNVELKGVLDRDAANLEVACAQESFTTVGNSGTVGTHRLRENTKGFYLDGIAASCYTLVNRSYGSELTVKIYSSINDIEQVQDVEWDYNAEYRSVDTIKSCFKFYDFDGEEIPASKINLRISKDNTGTNLSDKLPKDVDESGDYCLWAQVDGEDAWEVYQDIHINIWPVKLEYSLSIPTKSWDGTGKLEPTVNYVSGLLDADMSTPGAVNLNCNADAFLLEDGNIDVGDHNVYVDEFADPAPVYLTGSAADNYYVDTPSGELTVKIISSASITGNDTSVEYDGQPHEIAFFTGSLPENSYTFYTTDGGENWTDVNPSLTDAGSIEVQAMVRVVKDGIDSMVAYSGTYKLEVTPRTITITSASDEKFYDGTELTKEDASYEGGKGFVDGDGANYTFVGKQTVIGASSNYFNMELWGCTKAGNYTITKQYGTLTVKAKTPVVLSYVGDTTKTYDGQPLSWSIDVSNPTACKLLYSLDGENYTEDVPEIKDAGWYELSVKAEIITDGYEAAFLTQEIYIASRELTLISRTSAKIYDGQPLTCPTVDVANADDALAQALAQSKGIHFDNFSEQTEVGSTYNDYIYYFTDGFSESNYDISFQYGKLTVVHAGTLDINEPAQTSWTYDGETHTGEATASGFSTSGGVVTPTISYSYDDGLTYTDEVPSLMNAGELKVKAKASLDGYEDVECEYTLTVSPKKLVITSGSNEKYYDGFELVEHSVTVTDEAGNPDSFVFGEGAEYSYTGKQTEVAVSPNTFTYTLKEGTLKDNYTIVTKTGTLRVKALNTITISYDGATTWTYDGNEHVLPFTVTPADAQLSYTIDGIENGNGLPVLKNAGTYTVKVTAVREDYEIAEKTVTIIIDKMNVTLESKSAGHTFDGKVFTCHELVADPVLAGTDDVKIIWLGKIKEVGTEPNSFEYQFATEEMADNYAVTTKFGELTVVPQPELYIQVPAVVDYVYSAQPFAPAAQVVDVNNNPITDGVKITYSVNGGKYTEKVPSLTNVGNVYVSVRATKDGYHINDADYVLTVTPAKLVFYSQSKEKTYDGEPMVCHEATPIGLLNGEEVTYKFTGIITNVGEVDNAFTVVFKGSDNYDIYYEYGKLTVKPQEQIMLSAPNYPDIHFTYDGNAHNPSVVIDYPDVAQLEGKHLSITYSINGGAFTEAPEITKAGSYNVHVLVTADGYADGELYYTMEVYKAPLTLESADAEKVYDGFALTQIGVTATGLKGEDRITYTMTGEQTLPGSSQNTFTYHLDNEDCYIVNCKYGKLTVTKLGEINIKVPEYNAPYDGKAHGDPVKVVDANGTDITDTVQVTYSVDNGGWTSTVPTIKNAGTIRVTAKAEKTGCETVYAEYTLTVSKIGLVLTSGSKTKIYDGQPLTCEEITKDGLISGEELTIYYTGARTEVGSSNNTFEWKFATEEMAANYNVSVVYGMLTVYDELPMTLKATGYDGVYDGTSHAALAVCSETDATVSYSVDGGDYTTKVPSERDAGTYNITAKAEKAGYATVSINYTIKIAPHTVKITSKSASKVYDGTALVYHAVEDYDLCGEDALEITFTGKQTEVGESENTFDYAFADTAMAKNYTIVRAYGWLQVSDRPTMVLTTEGYTAVYDGTFHSVPAKCTELDATVSYSVNGGDFTTQVPAVKDVGTYNITAKAEKPGYVTVSIDYTITITPHTVKITSKSATKVYDGTELVYHAVEDYKLCGEDALEIIYTGTQTEVGESENTFECRFADTAMAKNYTIVRNYGWLQVSDRPTMILTTPGYTGVYDGVYHYVSADCTELDATVSYSVNGGDFTTQVPAVKDVGTYNITAKAEKTGYVTVSIDYTVTIAPYVVTITSKDATKIYDGKPLVCHEVEKYDLCGQDALEIEFTGTQTDVGESKNTFDYRFVDTNLAKNYTIVRVYGKLAVYDELPMTISAIGYDGVYDGTSHAAPAYCSQSDALVTYSVDGGAYTANIPSEKNAGTYNITAKAEKAGYVTVTIDYTIKIAPHTVTITSKGASKVHDGTALICHEVEYYQLFGEDALEITFTGKQTEVGESENTFECRFVDTAMAKNYTIVRAYGWLKVTNRSTMLLSAVSYNGVYDGETHYVPATCTESAARITYSVNGGDFTTQVPTVKNVGSYNVVAQAELNGYVTETVRYTMTVTKRGVVLTSASDSKSYDGKPLSNDTVTVSGEGFAPGEYAKWNVTGSQTAVGSSKNVFSYELYENTDPSNYNVTRVFGTLTVTDNPSLVVYHEDYYESYDGNWHGGAASCNMPDADITYCVLKDAGTDPRDFVHEVPEIKDVGKVTVVAKAALDGYDTATWEYTLEVVPRYVVFTSGSATAAKDCKPLTCDEVKVTGEGLVAGETVTFDVTGSQEKVGVSENLFTYSFEYPTLENNYDVEVVYGKLTVTGSDKVLIKSFKVTKSGSSRNLEGCTIEMKKGTRITCKVSNIRPAKATGKVFNWKSSNVSVVSVNKGKLVARNEGLAKITVTAKDGSKTRVVFTVKVTK